MALQLTRLLSEPFSGVGTGAGGLPGTPGDPTGSQTFVAPWWRASYPFRHQYVLSTVLTSAEVIPVGHPAVINFTKAATTKKGKVRGDFADVAVLYLTFSGPILVWTLLPTTIVDKGDDTFDVVFPLQRQITNTTPDNRYYIYYGNESLTGALPMVPFDVPPWPVSVPADGLGVSFTKPGDHWTLTGSSAQATPTFLGSGIGLGAGNPGGLVGVLNAFVSPGSRSVFATVVPPGLTATTASNTVFALTAHAFGTVSQAVVGASSGGNIDVFVSAAGRDMAAVITAPSIRVQNAKDATVPAVSATALSTVKQPPIVAGSGSTSIFVPVNTFNAVGTVKTVNITVTSSINATAQPNRFAAAGATVGTVVVSAVASGNQTGQAFASTESYSAGSFVGANSFILPQSDGTPDQDFFGQNYRLTNFTGSTNYIQFGLASTPNKTAFLRGFGASAASALDTSPGTASSHAFAGGFFVSFAFNWVVGRKYEFRVARFGLTGSDSTWIGYIRDYGLASAASATFTEYTIGSVTFPVAAGTAITTTQFVHSRDVAASGTAVKEAIIFQTPGVFNGVAPARSTTLPWNGGLVNVNNFFPAGGYTAMAGDVFIGTDPSAGGPTEGFFYSLSTQMQSGTTPTSPTNPAAAADGIYLGLQTLDSDLGGKSAHGAGFGAINARAATENSGVLNTFNNEGSGFKVSIPYPWVTGRKYHINEAQIPEANSTTPQMGIEPGGGIVYYNGWYYLPVKNAFEPVIRMMRAQTIAEFSVLTNASALTAQTPIWQGSSASPALTWIQFPLYMYRLQGRWYIYFNGATTGSQTSSPSPPLSDRFYIIEADTDDPMGTWTFRGKLGNLPDPNPSGAPDQGWTIGWCPITIGGTLYMVSSNKVGHTAGTTHALCIAQMSSPTSLVSGGWTPLTDATDFSYEEGPPGTRINEVDQPILHNGKQHVIFSAKDVHSTDYCASYISYDTRVAGTTSAAVLNRANWHKATTPLLSRTANIVGPGQTFIFTSSDGSADYLAYAYWNTPTVQNPRHAAAIPITWDGSNNPTVTGPASAGTTLAEPPGKDVYRFSVTDTVTSVTKRVGEVTFLTAKGGVVGSSLLRNHATFFTERYSPNAAPPPTINENIFSGVTMNGTVVATSQAISLGNIRYPYYVDRQGQNGAIEVVGNKDDPFSGPRAFATQAFADGTNLAFSAYHQTPAAGQVESFIGYPPPPGAFVPPPPTTPLLTSLSPVIAFSGKTDAQASFVFSGTKVRMMSNTGLAYGIASLQLDDFAPLDVNLYAPRNTGSLAYGTGHFFDSRETFPPNPAGYITSEIDITPLRDGSPDGYLYAHDVYFSDQDQQLTTMYIGLQTLDPLIGTKSAHFAGFGALNGTGPAGVGPIVGESPGWKTAIPFQWRPGHRYSFQIKKLSDDGAVEWWGGFITDEAGTTSQIGQVQYPSSFGNLAAQTATFHERVFGDTHTFQPSAVLFSGYSMNGTIEPVLQQVFSGIDTGTNPLGIVSKETVPAGFVLRSETTNDPVELLTPVWVADGLDPGIHRVFVRVSGRKDPRSVDNQINFQRFEYQQAIALTDRGEENDDLSWSSVFVGGKS